MVGAGRGPLVRASLKASAETGRRIRVYAVEKNLNAVVTLQNLVESEGCGPPAGSALPIHSYFFVMTSCNNLYLISVEKIFISCVFIIPPSNIC